MVGQGLKVAMWQVDGKHFPEHAMLALEDALGSLNALSTVF